MFGKKRHGETCSSCDRPIGADTKVCECGTATRHLTFEERTAYEVERWRKYRRISEAS